MHCSRLMDSGLLLPALSLGMWHNFGAQDSYDESHNMILHSFENGITILRQALLKALLDESLRRDYSSHV